jgi:hypothetical protein
VWWSPQQSSVVGLIGAATRQVQSDLQSLDLSSEWDRISGFEKELLQVCALGVASLEYPEYETESVSPARTNMSSMPDVPCRLSATAAVFRRSGAPFSHGSTGLTGAVFPWRARALLAFLLSFPSWRWWLFRYSRRACPTARCSSSEE